MAGEGKTDDFIYDRVFWLAYIANVLLVTANVMTFRFAEVVAFLGGTEQTAGTIVSVGVVGALLGRLFLGQAIDRFGVRRLWLTAASSVFAGCLVIMASRSIAWPLYTGRILFSVGLAGMFTCSIVHIQNRVPAHRRTEVIGNLGSSGFLGMICGSQISDLIGRTTSTATEGAVIFGGAALFTFCYLILVLLITRGDEHARPSETPPIYRLLFRHWPGSIMFVALMMGMNFMIPSVFLTRFSTHRGLGGIGTFWTAYAVSAFVFRVGTRQWSGTVGRHRMILLGIAGHCCGQLMFPFVNREWMFLGPAVCCGFGHALLFPAVVSLGTEAFPREYRGTGTTLVLGFFDLGSALFAPLLGGIIDYFDGSGFTQMFLTTAGCATVIGVAYSLTGARQPDSDLLHSQRSATDQEAEEPASQAESESVSEADDLAPAGTATSAVFRR